jgi:hypothetical protein
MERNMSVVFQFAGKAFQGRTDELALAFGQMENGLRKEHGFQRAVLLLNRLTLQCQLVFQWTTSEDGLAFERKFRQGLTHRFLTLMEGSITLLTSMLDEEIGAVPMARKPGKGAESGEVVLHFAGTASPEDVPRARKVLHDAVLPVLKSCPGFLGLTVLANHPEGRLQFLATLAEFDPAFAWLKVNASALLSPFDGVVRDPALPSFFAVLARVDSAAASAAN